MNYNGKYLLPEVATTLCVYNLMCSILTFSLFLKIYLEAALTAEHLLDVRRSVNDYDAFCRALCVAPRPSVLDTVSFFIEEPYFEATWKKIALALYNNNEKMALDKLFGYMKSPTGKCILQS